MSEYKQVMYIAFYIDYIIMKNSVTNCDLLSPSAFIVLPVFVKKLWAVIFENIRVSKKNIEEDFEVTL